MRAVRQLFKRKAVESVAAPEQRPSGDAAKATSSVPCYPKYAPLAEGDAAASATDETEPQPLRARYMQRARRRRSSVEESDLDLGRAGGAAAASDCGLVQQLRAYYIPPIAEEEDEEGGGGGALEGDHGEGPGAIASIAGPTDDAPALPNQNYTNLNLLRRESLRFAPAVLQLLGELWGVARQGEAKAAAAAGSFSSSSSSSSSASTAATAAGAEGGCEISLREYMALFARVMYVLRDEQQQRERGSSGGGADDGSDVGDSGEEEHGEVFLDVEKHMSDDSRRMLEEEFASDTCGAPTMDKGRFSLALFQLTDKWTDSISEVEYCDFLRAILGCISKRSDGDGDGDDDGDDSDDDGDGARGGARSGPHSRALRAIDKCISMAEWRRQQRLRRRRRRRRQAQQSHPDEEVPPSRSANALQQGTRKRAGVEELVKQQVAAPSGLATSRLHHGTSASDARKLSEEEAGARKERARNRVANPNVGAGSKAAHKRAQVHVSAGAAAAGAPAGALATGCSGLPRDRLRAAGASAVGAAAGGSPNSGECRRRLSALRPERLRDLSSSKQRPAARTMGKSSEVGAGAGAADGVTSGHYGSTLIAHASAAAGATTEPGSCSGEQTVHDVYLNRGRGTAAPQRHAMGRRHAPRAQVRLHAAADGGAPCDGFAAEQKLDAGSWLSGGTLGGAEPVGKHGGGRRRTGGRRRVSAPASHTAHAGFMSGDTHDALHCKQPTVAAVPRASSGATRLPIHPHARRMLPTLA
jgi:hypothetical protein